MNSQSEIKIPDTLNLLVFSVGGVSFGIDADQVATISAYKSEGTANLVWFHKELDYGDKAVSYYSPTVVTIRSEAALPYQVVIDSMEDIIEYNQNEIHCFPKMLEQFALRKGIWGILLKNEKMVLLLDFMLLLREKTLNEQS